MKRAALLALLALGCSNPPPPVPTIDAGPRTDSGVTFADTGPRDAGPEASAILDAGRADAGATRVCGVASFEEDVADLAVSDAVSPLVVAVGAGASSFAVVWNETRTVPLMGSQPDLRGIVIPTTGARGATVSLTNDASAETTPVIEPLGTGWALVYADDLSGDREIQLQILDAQLAPVGTPQRVSDGPSKSDDHPAFAATAAGALVVWIQDGAVLARAATAVGAPIGSVVPVTAATEGATSVSLGVLDDSFGVAWTNAMGRVRLQRVGATGVPRGAVTEISTDPNATGVHDAVSDVAGGAATFTVALGSRFEVRLRPFDGAGLQSGDERILTMPPAQGRGGSLAKFIDGYALGYRSVPTGTETTSFIRLLLATADGTVVSSTPIAASNLTGSDRVTLRISGDEQMLVAWSEINSATLVRAALIRCR